MRFSFLSVPLLLAAVLVACGGPAAERSGAESPAPPGAEAAGPAPPAVAREPVAPKRAGRPAERASAVVVERVRALMGAAASEGRCGPYRLLTDVREPRLLAACARLGGQLDATFRERYGVAPVGEPGETIFLFGSAADYRAFLAAEGGLRPGYAGVARGAEGFLALTSDDLALEATLATLAHELTHLVLRRALGSDLPRWLAEGLADGLGDVAREDGFGPLDGLAGIEDEARRLAWGYRAGKVESVARLVAADRAQFDRATVSFDYEQSALLVRYLLLDGALAHRFRAYLARLAAGERYSPEALRAALDVSWQELDHGLRAWIVGS